jgi:hypothetical protein
MTADNPAQQERLREVEPLISDRMGVLAETIAMENLGDHEGALTLVNSDRGKNTMDRIRGILRLMGDDEQRLLWIRQRQYTKDAGRSTALLYTLWRRARRARSSSCSFFGVSRRSSRSSICAPAHARSSMAASGFPSSNT